MLKALREQNRIVSNYGRGGKAPDKSKIKGELQKAGLGYEFVGETNIYVDVYLKK